ncbi:MAG TPA: MBL fold metallo-hydrolase [Terriglobia bacterium]|nr:MBL fold metallo-hydrolase [Terriglobia bacterium]
MDSSLHPRHGLCGKRIQRPQPQLGFAALYEGVNELANCIQNARSGFMYVCKTRHISNVLTKVWKSTTVCLLLILSAFVFVAYSQENNNALEVLRIRPNFYVISGAGGNISVQTGPDGTVLVDAGSVEAADRVVAAIKKTTEQPIRYIINTSADAGHVGGNGTLSRAGRSIYADNLINIGKVLAPQAAK